MLVYILLAFCAFLLYYFRKRRDYWKNRGIPYVEGRLILGNLGPSPFIYNRVSKMYGDIYKRFKGSKYCGMMNFGKPALLILDIDLIGDILVKKFDNFHDNMVEINAKEESILSRYLFFSKGEAWKQLRIQALKQFTPEKVKKIFPIITKVCEKMQCYLGNQVDTVQNLGLNIYDLGQKFNADIVISCIFSLDGRSFTDDSNEFIKMNEKMINTSQFNQILFLIEAMLPEIRKIKTPSLLSLEFIQWFKSFILNAIKNREQEQIQKDDFLSAVVELKNKTTSSEFIKDIVVGYCLSFLIDGIGTTTVAFHYVLYEVAANPDVQEKLQVECDRTLSQCDGKLTHDALQQMSYLDMVVMESIRKHPPLLFMSRACTKAIKFPPATKGSDEILIEKDMAVVIPLRAIHYDPQYYPEPDKFDPSRFTEEGKQSRPKYAFLGFGAGPRTCLGQRFAIVQIKAAIASIVSKFEIRVNEKTIVPLETDLDEYENVPKGGLWLNIYKRKLEE